MNKFIKELKLRIKDDEGSMFIPISDKDFNQNVKLFVDNIKHEFLSLNPRTALLENGAFEEQIVCLFSTKD